MTLYKADFLEAVGVPVTKEIKKGKKRAIEPDTPPETPERPTESGKQLPVKKPKTEKQLAALERARENRQRKKEAEKLAKEAHQKALEDAQKAVSEKEAEIEKKKLERKQKRAAKKVEKVESVESVELDRVIEEVVKEEKPKKAKKAKVVDDNEPPAWFKKYIEGQHIEKNELSKEKKPVAVIKKESKEVASNAWKDDLTRDRVNQERDNHMARMYSSIFGSKLASH